MKNKIELLAPAQNKEFGKYAINYGADAVYIGANKFGARNSASNTITDIAELIKYAHILNSKVYVTLNTILYNNELNDAEKLIKSIYEIGADALIIQDFGILEMNLPPIPIFASTQTHNIDTKKVQFLESAGFSRVILGRELSLSQIHKISKNTNIDLEAFVHGSLCVSYSGRCYLSHTIGGRSGNRGECAQPCRNKYTLSDNNNNTIIKDKHLLSLKDINLSDHIEEMIDAGISSFKIEGRLKDESYVKNVTAHYRQEIDTVLNKKTGFSKTSSGTIYSNFIPDINKTFNRGYSSYFINGRNKNTTSFDSPKSKGEFVGKIKRLDKNYITLDSSMVIKQGDGICYTDKFGIFKGCYLNKIIDNKIYLDTSNLIKGLDIYRNYDIEFNKMINKSKTRRLISIVMNFSDSDNGFTLQAEDEDNNKVSISSITTKEPAKNKELAEKNIISYLSKTGDTIFNVQKIHIETQNTYFISSKFLNELRRNCLNLLLTERKNGYKVSEKKIKKTEHPYPLENIDFSENISNKLAEKFYLRHGVGTLPKAYELQNFNSKHSVMKTKLCLKYELGECKRYDKNTDQKLPEFDSMFIENKDIKLKLDFICKECYMNITVVDEKI